MEPQRRDIQELKATFHKFGLTVAKLTESIDKLTAELKKQNEKED